MHALPRISLAALLLIAATAVGYSVLTHWFDFSLIRGLSLDPVEINACNSKGIIYLRDVPAQRDQYIKCADDRAKLFLEKDYLEAKDLAKAFLTLLTAVLVASITFSEKVVDVGNADLLPLSTMFTCWFFLIVAITSCGLGLAFMTTGAGLAAYQVDGGAQFAYVSHEVKAVILFLVSGVSFVFALLSLFVAGVSSLISKRKKIAGLSLASSYRGRIEKELV